MNVPLKQGDGSITLSEMTLKYFLDGNKIISQQDAANDISFYYGVDGITCFNIKYNDNDEIYYYKKNLQGDIIGIYAEGGTLIAKYDYDDWGNHTVKYLDNNDNFVAIESNYCYNDTSNTNKFIAFKNPFRYRGYYYDFETNLYYLNSRYYDSEIGRFINADDINILDSTQKFGNGLNLYVYCLSNPVNDFNIKSIVDYTNKAVTFMNKNANLLKLNYSVKYDMIRWIFADSNATGYFDSLGKIITFILKG